MLPEKILQSDLLDIIFENRNKSYGAYALRKFYNERMHIALSATILLSACFALSMLLHQNKQPEYVRTFIIPSDNVLTTLKPDVPKLPQPAHVQQKNFRKINYSAPVITSEDVKTTEPTIEDIDNSIISNITTDGDTPVDNTSVPEIKNAEAQSSSVVAAPAVNDNGPLMSADVMPAYPGGINALINFMLKNLRQPGDLQPNEKIKVIASFVVSRTGNIENVKIISSGRLDLDKEVLRVMNKMPLWKPGIQNGKTVAVYFNLPVTFQSADE